MYVPLTGLCFFCLDRNGQILNMLDFCCSGRDKLVFCQLFRDKCYISVLDPSLMRFVLLVSIYSFIHGSSL